MDVSFFLLNLKPACLPPERRNKFQEKLIIVRIKITSLSEHDNGSLTQIQIISIRYIILLTTSESLKLGIDNFPIVVNFNLQSHNISTLRSSNQTGTNAHRFLIQRPYIAWVFVVVNHLQKIIVFLIKYGISNSTIQTNSWKELSTKDQCTCAFCQSSYLTESGVGLFGATFYNIYASSSTRLRLSISQILLDYGFLCWTRL